MWHHCSGSDNHHHISDQGFSTRGPLMCSERPVYIGIPNITSLGTKTVPLKLNIHFYFINYNEISVVIYYPATPESIIKDVFTGLYKVVRTPFETIIAFPGCKNQRNAFQWNHGKPKSIVSRSQL
jgi:hypothetical protein